ncbi:uncharacterized protein LOC131010511 [Salvia miltiorrhiza]|uniref:uncharacterized protein LOC131010511 n=1 Tax=Salvia miltiorrhiza TaxID=226208 RepID=UPI0025ABFBAF|nr:uncharacterized protein LOC131010511 [Salvia miltiorrhiza]
MDLDVIMSSNDDDGDENTFTTYTSEMPCIASTASPAAAAPSAATDAETGLGTSNPTAKPPTNKRKPRSNSGYKHIVSLSYRVNPI